MPAKIFFLSVLTIGLGFLLMPTARYLIWGANVETEIISVPDVPTSVSSTATGRDLELATLLGRDAISAILAPDFVSAFEGDQWMEPDEAVLGISIDGDHKAYPIKMMSRHEIVNDVVGGAPVAVTW